jgi:hypothetical protein
MGASSWGSAEHSLNRFLLWDFGSVRVEVLITFAEYLSNMRIMFALF